ncbi:MAG: ATP-grasp domain-containing protein [Elusimicrobiota bacterium]
MGKSLKVLALFDVGEPVERGHDFSEDFKLPAWKSEAHVFRGLKSLGHEVRALGLHDDLHQLVDEIKDFRPDVVFNLMEEFNKEASMVPNVVAVLEMLQVPYTGASPMGLRLCKDKALTKTILTQQGISNPPFQVFDRDKIVKKAGGLNYPLVLKPMVDDASYGIHQTSVVYDDEQLAERAKLIHEKGQDALAEEYVKGRELYVSVLGTKRLRVFPIREVRFGRLADDTAEPVASYKVKWDKSYRRKWNITYGYASDLDEALTARIQDMARAAFRALHLTGYARVDMRLTPDNEPAILEVNPNPYIAKDEDFAQSAKKGGRSWKQLLQAIINEALSLPDDE